METRSLLLLLLSAAVGTGCIHGLGQDDLPPLPPIPEIPAPAPADATPLGNMEVFPEECLDLPVTPGPFEPTWESIGEHYPGIPAWLRDAGLLDGEVADVRLLGYDGALEWDRTGEALRIVCPDRMPFSSAVVFRIGPE